jgi:opacity protein-like surface antigen
MKKIKKIKLLPILLVMVGNMSYAGGDISPITIYEVEDTVIAEVAAEEIYVEPVIEEPVYVEPVVEEPVYIEPQPTPTPTPTPVVIAPIPVVKPQSISPSGVYAGLGIVGARYDSSCDCKKGCKKSCKDTTYGGMARVGYDFNQYIGVEARGTKTNWQSNGSKVKHAGIYIKPMVPVADSTNIYGLVGVGVTKVTGSMPNTDAESLALGVGVEVDLSQDTPKNGKYSRNFDGQGDQEKGVGLFVDYERMVVKKDAPDLDVVTAGITYDF